MIAIEHLQGRLRDAHARIGHAGRFAFTIDQRPDAACYVTHWFRPTPHAFEDCRAVGAGTVEECLAGLERYVAAYRRQPTQEELAATLGVAPARAAA